MKNYKVFSGEEDEKISNDLVIKIVPLLKDKTFNQIEIALDKTIKKMKLELIIR